MAGYTFCHEALHLSHEALHLSRGCMWLCCRNTLATAQNHSSQVDAVRAARKRLGLPANERGEYALERLVSPGAAG